MSTKTKNTFATSMFEQIRDSLKTEKKTGNTNFKDIMKFEIGNTYLVRLVPNIKNPNLTFYHYFSHGWTSLATGQYISALCPSSYGESCPIDNERFKIWKTGTDQEKESAKAIKRKENWLVNAYIISDPTKKENEGTVKMIRYGAQLHKIIDAAINGDDIEEFGAKIFDLSENGCTLRIKVEANAEGKRSWPTYAASRFLAPSAIPGMTEEKISEVHNQLHDLEKMETPKTQEQLQEMLDVHYHQKVVAPKSNEPDWNTNQKRSTAPAPSNEEFEGDHIDMRTSRNGESVDTDLAVDELLKDL